MYGTSYEGIAPQWFEKDCRGCWQSIKPGDPVVTSAITAEEYHRNCWDDHINAEDVVEHIGEAKPGRGHNRKWCTDCRHAPQPAALDVAAHNAQMLNDPDGAQLTPGSYSPWPKAQDVGRFRVRMHVKPGAQSDVEDRLANLRTSIDGIREAGR